MSGESSWTWKENKQFEDCLVEFGEDYPDRWSAIAARLGTKSAAQVEQHYAALLEDIYAIEAGLVEPPKYAEKEDDFDKPWTDEERRLFALGLEKYGKGEWNSIARYMVKTRTPAQISSYAAKYLEDEEEEEEKKEEDNK